MPVRDAVLLDISRWSSRKNGLFRTHVDVAAVDDMNLDLNHVGGLGVIGDRSMATATRRKPAAKKKTSTSTKKTNGSTESAEQLLKLLS